GVTAFPSGGPTDGRCTSVTTGSSRRSVPSATSSSSAEPTAAPHEPKRQPSPLPAVDTGCVVGGVLIWDGAATHALGSCPGSGHRIQLCHSSCRLANVASPVPSRAAILSSCSHALV